VRVRKGVAHELTEGEEATYQKAEEQATEGEKSKARRGMYSNSLETFQGAHFQDHSCIPSV
jgi:hypothetical protein